MFLTREADYGIRTVRALASGKKMNIAAICEKEDVPRQFAYKILKKLNHAGFVSIERGVSGGYTLKVPVGQMTLYDIVSVINEELFLNKCLEPGYQCERNPKNSSCKVHAELVRIQNIMVQELKRIPLSQLV